MSTEHQDTLKLFEKLRIENQDAIKNFTEESSDGISSLKLSGKAIANENSVREDLAMLNRIEQGFQDLNKEIRKMNRCSASEYSSKFIILHQLFEHSGFEDKQEFYKARAAISEEYASRFSRQHPIEIYDDRDPNTVLVVIPPIESPINLIKGYDTWAVDQFHGYATHDRPDISSAAQAGLIQATVNAQKVTMNERVHQHARTNEESIKVLKYFYPDHPLIKQLEAQGQIVSVDAPVSQSNEVKPGLNKTQDGTYEIGDLDDEDLGI